MSKAGLDNRHRNKDGEVSHKHGNTLIRSLRKVTDRVSQLVILKPKYSARFCSGLEAARRAPVQHPSQQKKANAVPIKAQSNGNVAFSSHNQNVASRIFRTFDYATVPAC
jgi:hypothetical protein